uniref:Heparan-alpha-glucosaminide N-acetyltransferase catalytic domain-containing protein n=1 Tax=Scophthalmus maximus TaxID=52904 RepID=A0A8D3C3S1_SCOMX
MMYFVPSRPTTMSKQGTVGSGNNHGKGETGENETYTSSCEELKRARPREMTRPEKCTFPLAALALVAAVCVAPLAADMSTPAFRHRKHGILKMDEALLTVNNELDTGVVVSWISERCHQCLYQQLGVVPAAPSPARLSSVEFVVSTQHEITLQLNSTPVNLDLCMVPFHFGEHGNYSLWLKNLNNSSVVNCSVVTDADPINSFIPILVAFLIFAGLVLVSAIGRTILGLDVVKSILFRIGGSMETERLINSELGSPGRTVPPVTDNILPPLPNRSKRLRSLDTFRGISLVIMVFVNYGGGRYWFFRHESWNGLTVADLVFPWFVFIMGTSIALSTNFLLLAGSTRCSLLRKVVGRSLQLFIIGVLIINPNYCQGPLSWDNLRIPGVLQRLAWSYLVVACLDLLVAKGHLDILTTGAWWSPFLDILLYWPAWLCMLLLEILWLFLTFQLPVPDCPTGYLGPGGIGDMGLYPNCTGGAAGFIDRWLLGENHIYKTPSSRGAISALLTKCSTDQGFIPVNKNLWSLSYVTTLACFAFVLLVLLYYTVDVKRWWSGAPFYYPGMNSILVYVGHEVFEEYFPFRWRMANSQSHAEHLIQNLVATSCWVFISYVLYRKKIFWKI